MFGLVNLLNCSISYQTVVIVKHMDFGTWFASVADCQQTGSVTWLVKSNGNKPYDWTVCPPVRRMGRGWVFFLISLAMCFGYTTKSIDSSMTFIAGELFVSSAYFWGNSEVKLGLLGLGIANCFSFPHIPFLMLHKHPKASIQRDLSKRFNHPANFETFHRQLLGWCLDVQRNTCWECSPGDAPATVALWQLYGSSVLSWAIEITISKEAKWPTSLLPLLWVLSFHLSVPVLLESRSIEVVICVARWANVKSFIINIWCKRLRSKAKVFNAFKFAHLP